LALLVEPQEFLVKLLLALLEVGELLLDSGTQLFEILGGVVGESGAERRCEANSPKKECRRAPSNPLLPMRGD
jgi:hypothetical protein